LTFHLFLQGFDVRNCLIFTGKTIKRKANNPACLAKNSFWGIFGLGCDKRCRAWPFGICTAVSERQHPRKTNDCQVFAGWGLMKARDPVNKTPMLKTLPATVVSRLPLAELEPLQSAPRAYACALLGRPEWVEDIVQNAKLYKLSQRLNQALDAMMQGALDALQERASEFISRRIPEIHTSHFLLDTCGL
jgi:hypothetical protein